MKAYRKFGAKMAKKDFYRKKKLEKKANKDQNNKNKNKYNNNHMIVYV